MQTKERQIEDSYTKVCFTLNARSQVLLSKLICLKDFTEENQ